MSPMTWTEGATVDHSTVEVILLGPWLPMPITTEAWTHPDTPVGSFAECATPDGAHTECTTPSGTWSKPTL